jgi:inorganic pyrophosphatase/exopolyphosphatase
MKIYKYTFIALCAVVFAGCSMMQTTPSPTEVFKSQVEAQKKKDVATMKQNLSKGSLELMEKAAKQQNKTVDELLATDSPMVNSQSSSYETRNETITGDTATLEVKVSQSEDWIKMPFVKEDGKWKMALDVFMQDLMQKMTEQLKSLPTSNGAGNTSTAAPANK